ncbi:MAG: LPS assembly lipoprotein LptE [Candidatus Marinimicrobia bacterium]|nr:LPS assembly lipoprotein LptE [Candidatus Neomarinimicrobiota bacterium]
MKGKNLIVLLLGIALLFSGCIWKYSPRPGTIPPHIKSVAIEETENNTAEFNLGQEFTAMMTDKMQIENILPLSDPSSAHSIIYTEIKSIRDAVYSYDESEVVKEYRLTQQMDFRWYDTEKDENIMQKTLSEYEIYYSDQYNRTLAPADQVTREEALDRLLNKMTEKVMVELTSQW